MQAEIDVLFAFVVQIRSEALLRRLDLTALRTLCSTALEFHEWDPDSLIFSQGDVSTCCYVMLSGSISVWIKSPEKIAAEAAAAAAVSVKSKASTAAEAPTGVDAPTGDQLEAAVQTEEDAIAAEAAANAGGDEKQVLHGKELRSTLGDCIGKMAAGSERSSFGEVSFRVECAFVLIVCKKRFYALCPFSFTSYFFPSLQSINSLACSRAACVQRRFWRKRDCSAS